MGSKPKEHDSKPSEGDGASPGKIFIGGLHKDTSLATFTKYFGKYGEITDSVIMKDRFTGQPRGFGFITYADPSVVDKVIEETHVINGKQVEIKRTIPKGSVQSKDFKTKKIFVGGVPTTVTEDEFKNFFSKHGKVVEHQIIRDHTTNRSRGFGFIVFDNEQVVDDLLANGNMIDMAGTQVEIKKAEPKKASNPPPPPFARDSRARSFGDGFGGYGDSYGGFGGGEFGAAPYRTPGLGGRLGGYGGGYGGALYLHKYPTLAHASSYIFLPIFPFSQIEETTERASEGAIEPTTEANMATTTTTVSAWGKPGAWALDSEAHEEELLHQPNTTAAAATATATATSDFPSLSAAAAAATKTKKKKSQTLSLSEFATGKPVTHGSAKLAFQFNSGAKGLTHDELLVLPTGPRERSADELERSSSRLGGGFRSYGSMDNGGGGAGRSGGRYSSFSNGGDDSSNGRWGSSSSSSSSRVSEDSRRNLGFNNNNNNREFAPSRADEIDDWGAAKKSVAPPAPYERRERSNGGGGFFESHSRADESDSWLTKKSFVPSEPRRYGFENNKDRRGGFEGFQKEGSDGGEADTETWLKKKEEGIGGGSGSGGGRPRLVLQPRTLPVSNGGGEQQQSGSSSATKSKSSNPFGAARPREEVLAEKGQDWKKIDEQLESMKIKENGSGGSGDGSSSPWKKSFGSGNGRASLPDGRAERSWKKTESADAGPPQSEEMSGNKDEGVVEGVIEN